MVVYIKHITEHYYDQWPSNQTMAGNGQILGLIPYPRDIVSELVSFNQIKKTFQVWYQ